MTGESDIGRKHLAHPLIIDRHNEPVIIYLTVCSQDRKSIFAFEDSAAVIVDAWQRGNSWLVGRYVIMPDWENVINNPVRAGLVKGPNDWPLQGELNIIPW